MATTTSLIETFQSLNVADDVDADQPNPTCLPFNPGRDFESAQAKAGRVDRYLFRLFDKHSDGCTNHVWVKSRDAEKSRPTSNTDIFARADRRAAAQALRRHLQWDGQPHQEDNFVSWTSSLLVVLQYAFYRSQWFGDLDFAAMNLCVVDTSLLPDGAFLNDMALIEAFSRHDSAPIEEKEKKFNLTKLNALRKKKHINFSGSYYFGEYLSQGALNIEACSSIVSMGQIIDDGLGLLRPELANPDARNGQWANRVIALREAFYTSEPHGIAGDNEVAAAVQIGQAYGPSWELPVALAFLALKPRPDWDGTIIKAFRKLYNRDQGAVQLSPENMVVVLHDKLPEVQQFDKLRRCVYDDSLLRIVSRRCEKAKDELQQARQLLKQVLLVPQMERLLGTLGEVAGIANGLEEQLLSK